MSDLTYFLLARIAEVEMFAEGIEEVTYRPRWRTTARGEVMATTVGLDPKAVLLAECEAKRRIVEDATPLETASGDLCEVVRLLAAVYADHPDYREEWRP